MKRWLYILFLVLLALPLHAQSEETTRILSYIQKAMNFNKVVPQEKTCTSTTWATSRTRHSGSRHT